MAPVTSPVPDPAVHDYNGHINLQVMSRMSNYNRWIFDTIRPYLGRSVLEAGCGNGNITRLILDTPGIERYVGIDRSDLFCDHLRTSLHFPARIDSRFAVADLEDPEFPAVIGSTFESIVCLNVLEHIADDLAALRRFDPLMDPGGRLILQVPAFASLYGTIDTIDGHYRRYRKSTLVRLLHQAGFDVAYSTYFNMAGIPAWIWHGKIRKLTTHSYREAKLWDAVVPLLRWSEQRLRVPAGLSVIAVATKPNRT